ncbi:hypothetical protein PRUPE_3G074100 [Prunus persica]|uniref:Tryptophan synthase beta chain-like PALP domain-containing protein n=1 Tax=Prunus persica TaxID=3760 RepID=A0A251PZY0_PRUPE|nr:hypothetical protein PRUPE_3G074100 [Prunus persica]
MEALHVSPAFSLLLRSQRLQSHLPNGPQKLSTRRPIKPFVSATLSRPTARFPSNPPPLLLPSRPERRHLRLPIGSRGICSSTRLASSESIGHEAVRAIGSESLDEKEDLQPVFSFKLRGAYNMMPKLPREQLDRGVICSSTGNHAQGVALAAKELNCSAVIAMPVTTPEIKLNFTILICGFGLLNVVEFCIACLQWKSVERLGATVILIGDSYDEAQTYAKKQAQEEGRSFIPPFDHPDVIIGQGTLKIQRTNYNSANNPQPFLNFMKNQQYKKIDVHQR